MLVPEVNASVALAHITSSDVVLVATTDVGAAMVGATLSCV